MLRKNVMDIFRAILSENALNTIAAVPRSDDFIPGLQSRFGLTKDEVERCIRILKETNRIFVFDVEKEDKARGRNKVEGYVDSDLSTLRRLKNIFHKELAGVYEEEFGKHIPVHQVIRELLPIARQYSGTALGFRLNASVMLEEYELLLEKSFNDYTEKRKDELLETLLKDIELSDKSSENQGKDTAPDDMQVDNKKRAADTRHAGEVTASSLDNIERTLHIYGVEFFYRVNLRKYNFSLIRTALEQKVIGAKQDLVLLKAMLRKMKANIHLDPELAAHEDEIQLLERVVYRLVAFI